MRVPVMAPLVLLVPGLFGGSAGGCAGDDGAGTETHAEPTESGSGGESSGTDETATEGAGSTTTSTGGSTGESTGGAETEGTSTGAELHGVVDLVPIYEPGSAWIDNPTAQAMVESVFADVEGTLRTSGPWDATIEVFLTDDNPGFAHTTFDTPFVAVEQGGQTVLVVGPWAEIVQGAEDLNGPAQADGSGHDFAVHFNVSENADNAGLLRHEIMHGLGAVNSVANPTMSAMDVPGGPTPGARQQVALYDLQIVDANGDPLVGDYDPDDGTFAVQPVVLDGTMAEWTDGSAGLRFRGVADDASDLEMELGTFPNGDDAILLLNEPSLLMSAAAHPTWNTVAEPDRAFFRALGYSVAP